jgi:beta-lactamase regulating signal transducer with metallopeptidase domain
MGPTIEMLNDLSAVWSDSLLRASWQGALAIAAAWLLVRCRPMLSGRAACWIWRLVDLKLIVALLWATPLLLPLLPAIPQAEPLATGLLSAPGHQIDAGDEFETIKGPAIETAKSAAFPRLSLASVAFCFWMTGVASAVVLARKSWLAAVALRRLCPPIDRPDLHDEMADLARILHLRRIPELRTGDVVARPMLVGTFRPAILLPVAMLDDLRSAVAIRPILAHELAHIRRHDLLWSGLTSLVRALFFFHPLVWLAHREALLAREIACDALALRISGVKPTEYGRTLLRIATRDTDRSPWRAASLGMADSIGPLRRRIMAMKTIERPSRRRLFIWVFALMAIGAAGIIPWKLVPRAALAQKSPADQPKTTPGHNHKATPASGNRALGDQLKIAEALLKVAQAEEKVADAEQQVAEKVLVKHEAEVERRDVEVKRLERQVKRGVVDPQILSESRARLTSSTTERDAAQAVLRVSHASLDASRASVREAEAIRDIARSAVRGEPDTQAQADLKKAQARLREARRDRAHAERDIADAETGRATAKLTQAETKADFWKKEVERLKREVARGVVDPQILRESSNLFKVSDAARDANQAQVGLARARLEAAEARLEAAEAEVRAIDKPRVVPPARSPH